MKSPAKGQKNCGSSRSLAATNPRSSPALGWQILATPRQDPKTLTQWKSKREKLALFGLPGPSSLFQSAIKENQLY